MNSILKSYAYYGDKVWFVSTIKRQFDTCCGIIDGEETLAWEYDEVTKTRGEWVYQGGGVQDHIKVCECLTIFGEIPNESNPAHERFFEY